MKRTIKITTKTEDLVEVLSNLKLSEDFKKDATFTLELEIEDSKENYNYLAGSNKIVDWDFKDEEEEIEEGKTETEIESPLLPPKEESCTVCCSCQKEEPEINKMIEEVKSLGLRDYSDLLNLIYQLWDSKRYNDFLMFDLGTIKEITPKFRLSRGKIVFTDDQEFLASSNYLGLMLSDDSVILNIIIRIYNSWGVLGSLTKFNDVVEKIFSR